MAKKHFRRGKSFTLPLAVITPVIYPLLVDDAIGSAMKGDFKRVGQILMNRYGFADMGQSIDTYTKIILGLVVHKIAGKFGLNQALGRAGVPIIRI